MKVYDLQIATGKHVYYPREDTFFLVDTLLSEELQSPIVEIGVGTGTVSLALASRHTGLFVGTDVNFDAAILAHTNATANQVDLQIVCTDLLRCFRKGSFTTVLSNPPYLPADESIDPYLENHELLALVGGPRGTEVTERIFEFIEDTAYLVLSSLADNPISLQQRVGYNIKVVATLSLGLETLWILRIRI